MENLIASGAVDGVLDVTLTEVLHTTLSVGIFISNSDRLEVAGRLSIPQVVALGGLDFITFGPRSAIPLEYRERATAANNAMFVGVRTTQEECTRVGQCIANKLNNSRGPVTLFVPRGGLSSLSGPGNVLADPIADGCLFKAVCTHIDPEVVYLVECDEHINDQQFAHVIVEALHAELKHKL